MYSRCSQEWRDTLVRVRDITLLHIIDSYRTRIPESTSLSQSDRKNTVLVVDYAQASSHGLVSEDETGRRVTGAWTCSDQHRCVRRTIVAKGVAVTMNTADNWVSMVLSGQYENSDGLETSVAYLLICIDLVHRHADACEEQRPRPRCDACLLRP
jgi:hypothetical protein